MDNSCRCQQSASGRLIGGISGVTTSNAEGKLLYAAVQIEGLVRRIGQGTAMVSETSFYS